MSERHVWVVMGTTGEYSDRKEWPAKAFLVEARANDFCKTLNEWLTGRGCHQAQCGRVPSPLYLEDEALVLAKKACPDPHFSIDYTGTEYYVMIVDLEQ